TAQPTVAAARLDDRCRGARVRAAAGPSGCHWLRDHLGARLAAAVIRGGGNRGARRGTFLHRADIAAATDQARPHAGIPFESVRAQRRRPVWSGSSASVVVPNPAPGDVDL